LASVTENTGKVLTVQAKQFIFQLRKAGYTVSKAKPVKLTLEDLDTMLDELDGLL